MKDIKIILLDDHQIILDGLKTMLSEEKNITICGTYMSGFEALKNVLYYKPDIVITDLMMPDMSGIDFIRNMKSYKLKTKILILSMCNSINVIQNSKTAGADGFITKQNATRMEIMKAINTLLKGKEYFAVDLRPSEEDEKEPENNQHVSDFDNMDVSILTKIEYQVLQLFAEGFSNKDISTKLLINIKTVEKHKSTIKSKLNITSNMDLLKFAIKNNICCV